MDLNLEKTAEEKEKKRYEKALVDSVKKDFEERRKKRLPLENQWALNVRFLSGEQYSHLTKSGEIVGDEKEFFWQNRNVFNHIAPIMETRLAKLNRIAPSIGIRPKSDDDKEVERASVAEKLIENVFKQNNFKEVVKEAVVWSETCGTAFYKVFWDEKGGNVVGKKGKEKVYQGEVKIIAVSPFEVFPDNLNTQKIERCQSIIHAKALPVEIIKDKYGIEVVGKDLDVMNLTAINQADLDKKTVMRNCEVVIEKYVAPSIDYPNGRLITVCGEKLVYDGELPFINMKNGERGFPFVMQTALKVAGNFFGTSIIERLIPIQRSFNAVKNRKHEFLNRLSMGVYTVEDGSVDVDDLADEGLEPGKIVVYRQGGKAPELLKETSMTDDFSEEESKLLDEFISVSGVSDVSSSSKNASLSSGSALELLISQDNERLTMTAENIRNCYLEIAVMALKLYSQFTVGVRLIKTVDKNEKIKTVYADKFTADCDDAFLENENELLYTEKQKKDMILKIYDSGILLDDEKELRHQTKEKVLSLLGYKDLDYQKGLSSLHAEKAQTENKKFSVKDIPVEYMDDHKIHIDEHTRYMLNEYENLNDKLKEKIINHIKEHKDFLEENKNREN